ncbi:MAG: efflux RND transporter periplasmic adaptor subunit, partial [Desulfuromonadales bacterium]|nr:efflux RND transporter periplasmic adaptor subunit [Desulfuromonadales bacterium]
AMVLTTELAEASNCERVSLGFMRSGHLKLQAVSHSAEVGQKMNLTRAIEQVMEESILQRREVVYPPPDGEVLICREHEALSRQQAMANIVTFPLYHQDCYYGAITCERGAEQPFSERDIEFIRAIAALAGPALENKYVNDRPLPVKVKNAAKQQLERLFGTGYLGRKLALLALLGLVVFFNLTTGEYRLSADTSLEGAIRRAIVVPFGGYIDQATARAGDLVEKGQLLCSLDDRDLQLEKLAMVSQYRQMSRQYQESVAKHERAKAGIIKAQMAQSQAELDLLDSKLERTRLTSPFKGLLVRGDLSQRLGGAVEQGEVLFEVTPLDAYRVILKVDERRVADVQPGQHGTLVLSSLPQNSYPFTVDLITPITNAAEGRNYFRVEAHLTNIDDSLRPGMEGVGKISIDQRKLLSIWTRDLVEWVKLTLWNWLP